MYASCHYQQCGYGPHLHILMNEMCGYHVLDGPHVLDVSHGY
jgi:hypothetical protein